MINTSDFKTKTLFIQRQNAQVPGVWTEAIDFGYSGVKGFSPNSVFCFPSYARKMEGSRLEIAKAKETDIQYRDEDGSIWYVGDLAYEMITSADTQDSDEGLYGRNRYFSPLFLVIARTGIACGMQHNQFGSPAGKLVLQTGLPPKYLKTDHMLLKEALSGRHCFDIRIGFGNWMHFDFYLDAKDIMVMPQPMGALMSVAMDSDAKMIPDARKYFASNILVMDPGFGTCDFFEVRHGQIIGMGETFDTLGMKQVFINTIDKIYNTYKTEIQIPAMQKYLEKGAVKVFDRRSLKTAMQPITNMLDEASSDVCSQVLQKMRQVYNDLLDIDYLIVTGGTGAAWYDTVCSYLSGMETLTVLSGIQNDTTIPAIFGNARGYYLFMINAFRKNMPAV